MQKIDAPSRGLGVTTGCLSVNLSPISDMSDPKKSEFEKAAAEQESVGFFTELWLFMSENKKWWLLPLIMVLLIFAVLVVLSSTGLAPFIYTLF